MKKLLILTALMLLQANFAQAEKKTDMVIASVNNKAITLQELKNRIDLSRIIINRQLSAIEFDMIKKQALEQLINEELKRQYASKRNIKISSDDLKNAIAIIEKQRKIEAGTLLKNIPEPLRATVTKQIKDSIYDQKIIQTVIFPQVMVQESTVDRLLESTLAKAEDKEYNISQISIKYTPESKKTVAKIYKKLEDGDKFENIALAFSEGKKGSLGWFALNELNFNAIRELKGLKKGQYTKPFIEQDSWHIIKINDIKTTKNIDTATSTEYNFIEFSNSDVSEDTFDDIKEQIENINGYGEFKEFAEKAEKAYNFKVKTYNWTTEDKLVENQKELVINSKPSNFSKLKHKEDGSVRFVYLMDKRTKISYQVQQIKERIYSNLQNKESQVRFRTFLQFLRKNAFIEIR